MLKKRKLSNLLVLVFIVIGLFGCGEKEVELKDGMASFDRKYIPALALTSQNKEKPSKIAIHNLEKEMNNFKEKYYDSLKERDKSKVRKIESIILDAKKIINEGKDLIEAHEVLEEIRIISMEIREDNNIDYYIDYLTKFHAPMEEILLAAQNKDIKNIKNHLQQALNTWEKVENQDINDKLFKFNKEEMKKLNKLIKAERDSLNVLENAVTGGNEKEILTAGAKIKSNFAKIFISFGDFDSKK